MSAFDQRTVAKLAKVLELLASPYSGERAAAAQAADGLLRQLGFTWTEFVAAELETTKAADADEPPHSMHARARWVAARLYPASQREADFLRSMVASTWPPSDRQKLWLDDLVERVRAAGRAA